jgi:hypothetical protein
MEIEEMVISEAMDEMTIMVERVIIMEIEGNITVTEVVIIHLEEIEMIGVEEAGIIIGTEEIRTLSVISVLNSVIMHENALNEEV